MQRAMTATPDAAALRAPPTLYSLTPMPTDVLPPGYFTAPVAETDPLIAEAIAHELTRQQDVIELIASENIVSRAVLDVQGSILTNKTVEGYPGKRYHAGAALSAPRS